MASPIVGRTKCPECGFGAAHVKQSERCLYRYCPECGAQYHAKTQAQAGRLRASMRPEGPGATDTPTPSPTPTGGPETSATGRPATSPAPTPSPTPTPTPAPAAPKRSGLFGIPLGG